MGGACVLALSSRQVWPTCSDVFSILVKAKLSFGQSVNSRILVRVCCPRPKPRFVEGKCLLKKIINSTAALLLVVREPRYRQTRGREIDKREQRTRLRKRAVHRQREHAK